MRNVAFGLGVMDVVGRDNFNTDSVGERSKVATDTGRVWRKVVLKFQIKVLRTKPVAQLSRHDLGFVRAPLA
jgi:hypothetical protein